MLNKTISDLEVQSSNKPELDLGSPYPAVIDLIVNLGEQHGTKFGTDEATITQQLWIGFAFPTEMYDIEVDGEEKSVCVQLGRRVNVTTGDRAALTKIHKAVCKPSAPLDDMAGKPCTVVLAPGKGKNPNIDTVSGPMKGTAVKLATDHEVVVVDEDGWDNIDDFPIPDFIKDIVKKRVGGPLDSKGI